MNDLNLGHIILIYTLVHARFFGPNGSWSMLTVTGAKSWWETAVSINLAYLQSDHTQSLIVDVVVSHVSKRDVIPQLKSIIKVNMA